MIIESLKAENWGRHKSIDFDSTGDIVGLVGPNGSGKSSVLDLVEFLLTGETRDNLDSYVRNYSGNASGTMTFSKHGRRITIHRQVGKVSKRWLQIGDEPRITKATEVERALAEIFGADKKALASSVFVNQGDLTSVLFRDGAERTKAFLKLVNLSFCEQRVQLINQQIARVGSLVVDLTPAKDEAAMARINAQQSMNQKADELSLLPSYRAELDYLRLTTQASSEVGVLSQQIGELQIQRAGKISELEAKLGNQDAQQLGEDLAKTRADETASRAEADQYSLVLAELTHVARVRNEINQLNLASATALSQIRTINPDKLTEPQIKAAIADLDAQLKSHASLRLTRMAAETSRRGLEQAQQQLNALTAPDVDAAGVEAARQELNTVKVAWSASERWLALQDNIRKNLQLDCNCPECGQNMSGLRAADEAEVTAEKASVVRLSGQATRLGKVIADAEQQLRSYAMAKSRLEGIVATHSGTLASQQAKLDELASLPPEAELQAKKAELAALLTDVTTWTMENRQRADTIARCKDSLTHYPLGTAHWEQRKDYCVERLGQLREHTAALTNYLNDLQEQWNSVQSYQGQIQQIDDDLEQKRQRLAQLQELLQAEAPAKVTELMAVHGDANAVAAQLSAAEQVRDNMQGEYNATVQAYQAANDRFQELETRIGHNRKKMELLRDLHRLKDLLSNDGLPLMFIKLKFKQLAVFTQASLVTIGADFNVNLDPERDLEFSFRRLNELDGVAHPMNKMSGGQRVRLCVGFLMALQKIMLQEVGLLVLDEPLSGLDTAGKAQVVEFLIGLKQELENSEHQVWIVDHNPELEPALDKVLVLSNN